MTLFCRWHFARLLAAAVIAFLLTDAFVVADDSQPEDRLPGQSFGIDERVAWTTSRVVGSPDPPLPYTAKAVFSDITWQRPMYAKSQPGSNYLWIVQQGSQRDRAAVVLRVLDTAGRTPKPTLMLKMENRVVYGLEFHFDFEANGYVYVFSNGPTSKPERKNRISRFTVPSHLPHQPPEEEPATPVIDLQSELVVIEWRSMGHDGGELAFGSDGMLYISSGDGSTDSDEWLSGQDLNNLNGGVLRIDVTRTEGNRPYAIPPDNPFLTVQGARGELWAYGLRNPWRLFADRPTGQIWVGSNGQDLWETVHLIRRGENYGWSVYEGSHPFYVNRQRGPTPIVPPTIEHHHTEARSLTGGVVYRGSKLPDLNGAYIYGDYSTGRIWAARHNGTNLTWHAEIADTVLQIAGFATSPAGHLLVVDHAGGIYRIAKTPIVHHASTFPKKLSETGLFESVAEERLSPGVIPYSVNTPAWNDGATANRYLAVPNDQQISITTERGWNLPNGSVVVQTLSLPATATAPARRIETRLLHREHNEWSGYSYHWNERQDDAVLVASEGRDIAIEFTTHDGKPEPRTWRIPSRAECMTCHSRAVNYVLGLSSVQMQRNHDYGAIVDNQLRTFDHIGMFSNDVPQQIEALVDPTDQDHDLQSRAKSYLHANCSPCHVEAGGGNARMEFEFDRPLAEMRIVGARPQHATFGINNAMLVSPGDATRSVLLHRISQRGPGQMPPLVSNRVDADAVELIQEWIDSMPSTEQPFVKAWTMADLEHRVEAAHGDRSITNGKALYDSLGCIQCHRMAGKGGGSGPDLSNIAAKRTPRDILESILDPSKRIETPFASVVIVTDEGRTLEGRIESETDAEVTVRTANTQKRPITISKSSIEERFLSPNSMMPSEMLNQCGAEQILDLIAYLTSADQP